MKKSEKTEITIAKIIESAMTEFGTNGYTGGTVNNICKAGINKGLVYHNFASKDELYMTCFRCSCKKFIEYVYENGGETDFNRYMAVRMEFFNTFPNESHIFFEALLNPPLHLSDKINELLAEFNVLNEGICKKTLDTLVLRDGITMDDALSYFHLVQTMLNGYFSSPAFQNVVLNEKVKIHETIIPKLFDFMLYGIAKGDK
ncbi:MAG: TetR/AcrR family transcriptional regulator [Bacteroides sp.]